VRARGLAQCQLKRPIRSLVRPKSCSMQALPVSSASPRRSSLPSSISSAAANRLMQAPNLLSPPAGSRAAQKRDPCAGGLSRGPPASRTRTTCPATGCSGRCDAWMAKAKPERRTVRRSREWRAMCNPGYRHTRDGAVPLDRDGVRRSPVDGGRTGELMEARSEAEAALAGYLAAWRELSE
jgi:hypothetical protein